MADPLVLIGATVIDGTGAAAQRGRAVVVQDGRIQAVVDERQAPGGRTRRLDGLTLLPGLINCHVHLCFGGEADPGATMVKESYATTVINAAVRARRTILSADAVSFLAAAVLYVLAVGQVKGFAFTLGMSTVLDLLVVFLVTHPLVALASNSRVFSSPAWSGLGSVARIGAARRAAAVKGG